MFKLVAVGGKLRGQEFTLKDGENIVGKLPMNDVVVSLPGISKKHLGITVSGNSVYLEDLGSSNGTLLNGKLLKKSSGKPGDKIALPDVIFKLVFIQEGHIKPGDDESDDADSGERIPAPTTPVGKVVHLFQYKLMPYIHALNEEYEWRSMVAILFALFIFAVVALTIFPVLRTSESLLIYETAKRGAHYADEIARLNARALEQKNLDQLNTNFLEHEDGVTSYELFDLEGRIVRPISDLNSYITDSFSINARDWVLKYKGKGAIPVLKKRLDDGEIGIAQAIMAYNPQLGFEEPVGIIAIRFAPRSLALAAANDTQAFLEALTTSALIALVFFGIIYFLTTKPLNELRYQIEQVLRGKQKEVEVPYLMKEVVPLQNSVNTVLQLLREAKKEDDDSFDDLEEDTAYVRTLEEFLLGAQGPALVLNSEKNIIKINPQAEDLTGIRESAGSGMSLLDVARDQGFAATVIDLCDQSANSSGASQKGEYELTGVEYSIHVVALIGKDNFAKAFYVTFSRDDE